MDVAASVVRVFAASVFICASSVYRSARFSSCSALELYLAKKDVDLQDSPRVLVLFSATAIDLKL